MYYTNINVTLNNYYLWYYYYCIYYVILAVDIHFNLHIKSKYQNSTIYLYNISVPRIIY